MTMPSEVGCSVSIEVASDDVGNPRRKLKGTVREHERKCLTLLADEEIATAAAVRVQSKDLMWLGQVLSCSAAAEPKWVVQVTVNRSMLLL